jgi:hypothetical protein
MPNSPKKMILILLAGLSMILAGCGQRMTQAEIDTLFGDITKRYGVKVVCEVDDNFAPFLEEGKQRRFEKVKRINADRLKRFPSILETVFRKYPTWIIRKNLSAIYLAKEIRDSGIHYGGTYDQFRRIVYLAGDGEFDDDDIIHIFHHEFSSILLKNNVFFLNLWYENNPEGFKYRAELVNSWKKSLVGTSLIGKPDDYEKGFLNTYGQTYFENDFSEYSGYIFARPEEFKKIMDRYPRVRAKFLVWLDFYHEIDPIFTEDYFFNGGCASCEEAAASCGRWLTATLREVEAAPVHERSKAVLRGIARACPYLDARLRLFAERALLRSDAQGRATILVRGVTSLLPADAPAFAPEAKADGLAGRFPLTIAGELPAHLPKDLFAGTYLYAWALENQLTALDLYNADARKLVRALLLSAAVGHEEP